MKQRAVITSVRVDDELITFELSDGRVVSAPTRWSPRLVAASPAERADFLVDAAGIVVEWRSVDEHIGLWTLLGVSEDVVLEAAGFDIKTETLSA